MTLSGGQKQRLALAMATLANKRCMIFDEPTSGRIVRVYDPSL